MAIMRISRFRDSPETVLAFKHLSDFAEMQPVRDPVATLDAMDIELPMAFHRHASRLPPARRRAAQAMGERHDPLLTLRLDLERRHVQNADAQRAATV
jgi:hypothetical protein